MNQAKYMATTITGWRSDNEDTHIAKDLYNGNSIFGVFDGHGGPWVSEYLKEHLCDELQKNKDYHAGNYREALINTFIEIDK